MNRVKYYSSAVLVSAVLAAAAIAQAGCNCNVPPSPASFAGPLASAPQFGGGPYAAPMAGGAYTPEMMPYQGMVATNGPHWAPGGYEARLGSPAYHHDPTGGQYVVTGDPYHDHFGPGFQRHSLHGHYRYPYYNYRAPWYFPGRAVYNRNTNFAW